MNPASLENLELGRGDRWRGKLPIPYRAPAIVRQLFEEINAKRATLREVAEKAGLAYDTISEWRYQNKPTLENFIAAANAIGLDVVLANKGERKLVGTFGGRLFSAEKILCDVAAKHDLPPPVIRGREKTKAVVKARDEAILRIRNEVGLSLTEIGAVFRRDHTTILAALRRASQ